VEAVRRTEGWPVKRFIHAEKEMSHMCITVPKIKMPLKITSAAYGSHPVIFITGQTALIQCNMTQVYLNSVCYPYVYATCFTLYLGHPQACQYNSHTEEDTIKI
jgi:hypothetical protein